MDGGRIAGDGRLGPHPGNAPPVGDAVTVQGRCCCLKRRRPVPSEKPASVLEGRRIFYGRKDEYHAVWPVGDAGSGVLPATGQSRCYNGSGREIACAGAGQDGELRSGVAWLYGRFVPTVQTVLDGLTVPAVVSGAMNVSKHLSRQPYPWLCQER